MASTIFTTVLNLIANSVILIQNGLSPEWLSVPKNYHQTDLSYRISSSDCIGRVMVKIVVIFSVLSHPDSKSGPDSMSVSISRTGLSTDEDRLVPDNSFICPCLEFQYETQTQSWCTGTNFYLLA